MKALVSFHPIDLAFFDEFIAPLVAGDKVNPEAFLVRALRMRRNGWAARRFAEAVAELAAAAEPPKPDPGASRWTRLRANMEKIDYRPGELVRRAARAFDVELHLEGRPFFIAENSTEKVAAAVDAYAEAGSQAAVDTIARGQLAHLVAELARDIEPVELPEPPSDLGYRDELLGYLRKIHELARSAREGRGWNEPDAPPRSAAEALPFELPWRALAMHARVTPFWTARDVDGLETICRAAGVRAPDCLSPAWRLFGQACDEFPALKDVLGLELQQPRDVGAFVAPKEIAELILFLSEHGARIIAAAARGGEGPAATTLLRKIKECAVYAQRHGFGYLEASGLAPVWCQTE
jgi:hypothetical protein